MSPSWGNLRRLDLYDNHLFLGDNGAQMIASIIESEESRLEVLNVGRNFTNDASLVTICDALKRNKTLRHIGLNDNYFGSSITNDGLMALAETLKVNSTLDGVALSYETDGSVDEAFIAIANALRVNNTLNEVYITAESANETVVKAFQQMLRDNLVLENIWENLRDDMIEYYLKLNRIGRRRVIDRDDATDQEWLRVLEASDGDINCL